MRAVTHTLPKVTLKHNISDIIKRRTENLTVPFEHDSYILTAQPPTAHTEGRLKILSLKNKTVVFLRRFTPLPDSVLSRNMAGESSSSLDPTSGLASAFPSGSATPGMLTPTGIEFSHS